MSLTACTRRRVRARRAALSSLLFTLVAAGAAGAGPAAGYMPGSERPPGYRPDPGYMPEMTMDGPDRPDVSKATPKQRAAARRLLQHTHTLQPRFGTTRAARRGGYAPAGRWSSLGIRHFNSRAAETDDHALDPRHPESLLFWRGSDGRRRLVAAMYRYPSDARPPRPAGPLMRWHVHTRCVKPRRGAMRQMPSEMCPDGKVAHYGTTAMLHVWLTDDLASAYAMDPPLDALGLAPH